MGGEWLAVIPRVFRYDIPIIFPSVRVLGFNYLLAHVTGTYVANVLS